jgi:hypothetical protein
MPRVVGIDWATDPKNRALVMLDVSADFGTSRVTEVSQGVGDHVTVEACRNREHAVAAIDIPFGWPREFVRFATVWRPTGGAHAPPEPETFRFRLTDRIVRKEARKEPLSVAADRIAMGARAWAVLVATNALGCRIDTVGTLRAEAPTVIEVYPGASARVLGEPIEREAPGERPSYKKSDVTRRRLVTHVASAFAVDIIESTDEIVGKGEGSDRTDAFLAAITAAIYLADCQGTTLARTGWTIRRPQAPHEIEAAESEGWIYFPVRL